LGNKSAHDSAGFQLSDIQNCVLFIFEPVHTQIGGQHFVSLVKLFKKGKIGRIIKKKSGSGWIEGDT